MHVVMTMPHRGGRDWAILRMAPAGTLRPCDKILKVPGVRKVVVEQTWEPGWNSNRLTPKAAKSSALNS